MSRYADQEQIRTRYKLLRGKEINSREYISTTLHLDLQKREDKYIISQRGDRFDMLAYQYYGDASYWYIIANANNIYDSLMVQEGGRIKIPDFSPGFNNSEYIYDNFLR